MPVPVPTRTPQHQINKSISLDVHSSCLVKQSALKHLLTSLPAPPTGPPPAFTDRETWIKSLPPARRYKVRQEAVAPTSGTPQIANSVSTDVSMSKIRPSSTISVPPMNVCSTPAHSSSVSASVSLISVDKVTHAPLSNGKPWPPSPPTAIKQAIKADERRKSLLVDTVLTCDSGRDADDELSEEWTEDEAFFAGPAVYRQASIKRRISLEESREEVEDADAKRAASGAFNPVVEFDSDVDVPLAPFDGTLAASVAPYSETASCEPATQPVLDSDPIPVYNFAQLRGAPIEHQPSVAAPSHNALSPIPTTATPADMLAYNKKIAEPISQWVAEYIWKVVTHGMSLPPEFVAHASGYGAPARAYATQPPAYLADSIRTLLCATLLQPSAIFLALWYIARFPVFFGVFSYNAKSKEFKFRLELLGEGSQDPGAERTRQLLEAHAPFRLLLLGVMLANKWLDDNTFSNKTWHQVSGVPMRALNRLESLGLDLLSHDLSLLPRAWAQWLDHMQTYHRSLAPYPEPIGPPKDTPHVIIRRVIEDLIAAGSPPMSTGVLPEPIFLGLEERKKERERERLAKEQVDLSNLDLDEDGPLREEYLPRKPRMIERRGSVQLAKGLPPPAEWSPAADPPIHRTRPTYQAVQRPPPAPVLAHANAHVTEAMLRLQPANGYLSRTDTAFQETRGHGQPLVPTHEPDDGYCRTRYAGQSGHCAFAQPGPPSYVPTYSGQYPVVAFTPAPHLHPGPWLAAPPFVDERSAYQPLGTFDAPPASELFRPTWLRT